MKGRGKRKELREEDREKKMKEEEGMMKGSIEMA